MSFSRLVKRRGATMVRWIVIAFVIGGGIATAEPPTLPDRTPPGKPHFDSRGAKVGDQLPNLPMRTLDGKETSLGEAWAGGPTLLLTSSYTCPKSRATYPRAAELARKIAGRGVRVAVVYVIEAHPAGDPSPYTGAEEVTSENRRDQILCRQPTTLAERLTLANDFARRMKVEVPVFVDAMDNASWATLGGGPNMGVLVDADGIVLERQGWFDGDSMEKAIGALVPPHKASTRPVADAEREIDYTIYQLVSAGKTDELKALLDGQPALARRHFDSYRGQTLLQLAADGRSMEVVKLIVERGADVNAAAGTEPSPLHLAAERGRTEIAQYLIERGANVDARANSHGPTPLQEALFNKQPETAAVLVKAGAKPNFYTAAASGDVATLQREFLLDATILSRPDGRGRTALVYAAATDHFDSVKALLALGARDFPADHDSREAAWWAVRNRNLEMTRRLLDAGSDPNLFTVTITEDSSADFVRAMIAHKGDTNHVDDRGLRPLHCAAAYDRTDLMQLLLDAGADVNGVTTEGSMLFCGPSFRKGDTPLLVAVENGRTAAVEFLLKHGAKVNVHDEDGETPLHHAASQPPEVAAAMIELLIEQHADVNAADKEGRTPLDYAEKTNDGLFANEEKKPSAVAELLKKHGAVKEKMPEK